MTSISTAHHISLSAQIDIGTYIRIGLNISFKICSHGSGTTSVMHAFSANLVMTRARLQNLLVLYIAEQVSSWEIY